MGSVIQFLAGGAQVSQTPVLAFPQNVTAGNLLVAVLGTSTNTSSLTSISDTVGTVYDQVGTIQAQGRILWVYAGTAPASGPNTIQWNLTVSVSSTPTLLEGQGWSPNADQIATGNGTATTTPSVGPINTTITSDLLMAFMHGGAVSAGPAGWTTQFNGSNGSSYLVPGTVGSYSATFTTASSPFVGFIVAFYPSPAPVSPNWSLQQSISNSLAAASNTITAGFYTVSRLGDLLVGAIGWQGTATIGSLVDENGTSYTPILSTSIGSGASQINLAYVAISMTKIDSVPMTFTLTYAAGATPTNNWLCLAEFVPTFFGTNPIDASSEGVNSSLSGVASPSINSTLALANELVVCAVFFTGETLTPQSGWSTLGINSNGQGFFFQFATASGAQTFAPATPAATSSQLMAICAFSSQNPFRTLPVSGNLSSLVRGKFRPGGLVYLAPTYQSSAWNDPSTWPWSSPGIRGVVPRQLWGQIQYVNQNTFDWSYIDQVLGYCETYSKFIGLSIWPGNTAPQWLYNLGAEAFNITGTGLIPAPWDPIFLSVWKNFIQALASRYDGSPNIAYVSLTGVGVNSQAGFTASAADNAAMQADAARYGFSTANSGIAIWEWAYQQIYSFYAAAFQSTVIILEKGVPLYSNNASPYQTVALASIAISRPGQTAIKENAAKPSFGLGQFTATQIQSTRATLPNGFQSDHPAQHWALDAYSSAQALQDTINVASYLGGYFCEVYPGDISLLDTNALNAQLLANVQNGYGLGYLTFPPPQLPDPSTTTLNTGGLYYLSTLLKELFAAGYRTLQDINRNYYSINSVLNSGNAVLLNGIFYFDPNIKSITYTGSFTPAPAPQSPYDHNPVNLWVPTSGGLSLPPPPTLGLEEGQEPWTYIVTG